MRYSVGSGLGPRCNSRYIRTCCGMAAATPWRTPATTHGRYRLGSATRTSSTRCVIPSWPLIGLRTSGADRPRSRHRSRTRGWVGFYWPVPCLALWRELTANDVRGLFYSTSWSASPNARDFAERNVMECAWSMPGSLWLDSRDLDHLGPLRGFVGDEFAEIGGRASQRRATPISELGLGLWVSERRLDLLV